MIKVQRVFGKYQRYLATNAIFFTPELKAKLDRIETGLWSVICTVETAIRKRGLKTLLTPSG